MSAVTIGRAAPVVRVELDARRVAREVVYVARTLVDGNPQTDWIPITLPEPPPPAIYGLVYPPAAAGAHHTEFPDNQAIRVYNKPNAGVAGWSSPGLAAALPGQLVVMSFKDFPTPAMLDPWLSGIPATTPQVWVVYDHEVKANADPDRYRSGYVALRGIVNAHPNGAKVRIAENYMRYQVVELGQDVDRFHPTLPDGTPAADLFTMDCYSPGAQTVRTFMDPYELLTPATTLGARYRMPVAILEVGGSLLDGAPGRSAAARAKWIRDVVPAAEDLGIVGMLWFCAMGAQFDYELLDDDLSAQAWRDATWAARTGV